MSQTKRCSKCREYKPLDAFYVDKSRKDKRHPTCKDCRRAYTKSPQGLAQRQRWIDGGGRERVAAYAKTDAAKQKRNAKLKADRVEKKRRKIRLRVRNAIKAGRLHHPTDWRCLGCHGQAEEYHHPDYSRPFDVIAFCHICHMALHAHMRQIRTE